MTLDLYWAILESLDENFPKISASVEPPVITKRNEVLVFRYTQRSVEQALVLKAARVCSGLHAAFVLLQSGYLQELQALYRMLDEFGEDIIFIGDIIVSEKITPLHQQFLDDFWAEEFDVDGEPFQSSQKRKRVPRQKIQASIARQAVFPINPSDGQEVHRTLTKTMSGYVHGASPHIMEMYGGTPERYHTAGFLGTLPFAHAISGALNYFYRGLLNVTYVAILLRCDEAESELRKIKDNVEELTGAGQSDVEETLKKSKR